MNPTPFEQTHVRAANAGAAIIKTLVINRMIHAAWAYEGQMAELGGGAPPLSEVLTIGVMWNDITVFPVGEA